MRGGRGLEVTRRRTEDPGMTPTSLSQPVPSQLNLPSEALVTDETNPWSLSLPGSHQGTVSWSPLPWEISGNEVIAILTD